MTTAFVLLALYVLPLTLYLVRVHRQRDQARKQARLYATDAEAFFQRALNAKRERDQLRAQGIQNAPTDEQIAAGRW